MKITYEFATETVEIEVADDWANLVIDLDRQEYNNDHTDTRRHVSYDALGFDGESMITEDASITALEENDALHRAIALLPQSSLSWMYPPPPKATMLLRSPSKRRN